MTNINKNQKKIIKIQSYIMGNLNSIKNAQYLNWAEDINCNES